MVNKKFMFLSLIHFLTFENDIAVFLKPYDKFLGVVFKIIKEQYIVHTSIHGVNALGPV
jgi:hypothetical protein